MVFRQAVDVFGEGDNACSGKNTGLRTAPDPLPDMSIDSSRSGPNAECKRRQGGVCGVAEHTETPCHGDGSLHGYGDGPAVALDRNGDPVTGKVDIKVNPDSEEADIEEGVDGRSVEEGDRR